MTNSSCRSILTDQDLAAHVRSVVAQQLGIKLQRVSDQALLKDLGPDWLDRIELVIALEDQFGVEIEDSVVDHLQAVGDLVHFVENCPRP
jgi:acyl carrier protein